MLNISEASEAGVQILSLEGRLDTSTSADFDFALEPYSDKPTKLLVDMSNVQYVSSAGLRVFLMLAKKLQKSQGALVLCGLSASVKEVFDIAGFSKLLNIQPDRASGIAALG